MPYTVYALCKNNDNKMQCFGMNSYDVTGRRAPTHTAAAGSKSKNDGTQCSRVVPHLITDWALWCLSSVF